MLSRQFTSSCDLEDGIPALLTSIAPANISLVTYTHSQDQYRYFLAIWPTVRFIELPERSHWSADVYIIFPTGSIFTKHVVQFLEAVKLRLPASAAKWAEWCATAPGLLKARAPRAAYDAERQRLQYQWLLGADEEAALLADADWRRQLTAGLQPMGFFKGNHTVPSGALAKLYPSLCLQCGIMLGPHGAAAAAHGNHWLQKPDERQSSDCSGTRLQAAADASAGRRCTAASRIGMRKLLVLSSMGGVVGRGYLGCKGGYRCAACNYTGSSPTAFVRHHAEQAQLVLADTLQYPTVKVSVAASIQILEAAASAAELAGAGTEPAGAAGTGTEPAGAAGDAQDAPAAVSPMTVRAVTTNVRQLMDEALGQGALEGAARARARASGGLGPSPVRQRTESGSLHSELLLKVALLPGGNGLFLSSAAVLRRVAVRIWQREVQPDGALVPRSSEDDVKAGPAAAAAVMREAGGSREAAMGLMCALRHTASPYAWLAAAVALVEDNTGLVSADTQLAFVKRAIECLQAIQRRDALIAAAAFMTYAIDTMLRLLLHNIGRYGSELGEWCWWHVARPAARLQQVEPGKSSTDLAGLQLHAARAHLAALRAGSIARSAARKHEEAAAAAGVPGDAPAAEEAERVAREAAEAADAARRTAEAEAQQAQMQVADEAAAAGFGAAAAGFGAAAGEVGEPTAWTVQDLNLRFWLLNLREELQDRILTLAREYASRGTMVPLPCVVRDGEKVPVPALGPLDCRAVADGGQLYLAPQSDLVSPAAAAYGAVWALHFLVDMSEEGSIEKTAACAFNAAKNGNIAAAVAMVNEASSDQRAGLMEELQSLRGWPSFHLRRLLVALCTLGEDEAAGIAVGKVLRPPCTAPFLHGTAASSRSWTMGGRCWGLLHGICWTYSGSVVEILRQALCMVESALIMPFLEDTLLRIDQVAETKSVVQATVMYVPRRCAHLAVSAMLPLASMSAWADVLLAAAQYLGCGAVAAFVQRALEASNIAAAEKLLPHATLLDVQQLMDHIASPYSTGVPAKVAVTLSNAVRRCGFPLSPQHATWLVRSTILDPSGSSLRAVLDSLPLLQRGQAESGGGGWGQAESGGGGWGQAESGGGGWGQAESGGGGWGQAESGGGGRGQAESGGGGWGQAESGDAVGAAVMGVLQALMRNGTVESKHLLGICAILQQQQQFEQHFGQLAAYTDNRPEWLRGLFGFAPLPSSPGQQQPQPWVTVANAEHVLSCNISTDYTKAVIEALAAGQLAGQLARQEGGTVVLQDTSAGMLMLVLTASPSCGKGMKALCALLLASLLELASLLSRQGGQGGQDVARGEQDGATQLRDILESVLTLVRPPEAVPQTAFILRGLEGRPGMTAAVCRAHQLAAAAEVPPPVWGSGDRSGLLLYRQLLRRLHPTVDLSTFLADYEPPPAVYRLIAGAFVAWRIAAPVSTSRQRSW